MLEKKMVMQKREANPKRGAIGEEASAAISLSIYVFCVAPMCFVTSVGHVAMLILYFLLYASRWRRA